MLPSRALLPRALESRRLVPVAVRVRSLHTSPTVLRNKVPPQESTTKTWPSAPEESRVTASQAAGDAWAKVQPALRKAQEYTRKHPRKVYGALGGVLLAGGIMYFLSGDDGRNDPILGRPNPADVAFLSRVPTSKLISGWM